MSQVNDIRLWGRAMRERWPVNEKSREAIVNRLLRIVIDPSSSNREVTAATRVLVSAEAQNQQDEHKAADDLQGTIFRLAESFGIDIASLDRSEQRDQRAIPDRTDQNDFSENGEG